MKHTYFKISIGISLFFLVITLAACSIDPYSRPVFTGNRFLIAVGMNYPLLKDFKLNYAAEDAQDIANKFASQGYTSDLLTSSNDVQVSKSAMLEMIESRIQLSDEQDIIVIFIAGHTIVVEGEHEILMEDETSIGADELWGVLSQASGHVILLMDCCHAGTFVPFDSHSHDTQYLTDGPGYTHPTAKSFTEAFKSLLNPAKKTRFPKLWVVTSSGYHEKAFEPASDDPSTDAEGLSIENGFFTHYLLRGLSIGEDSLHLADLNHDSVVMLSELFAYIKDSYKANPYNDQPLPRTSGTILDVAIQW